MRSFAAALLIGAAVTTGCGGTQWSDRAADPTTVPARTSASAPATAPLGWVTYRDPSGVALQHPPKWTIQPSQLGPLFVFIDSAGVGGLAFRRNVNITSEPLPATMTASEYLRLSVAQLAQAGGKIEDNRAAQLGGFAARQVTWHLSKNGTTVRFLSVWTLRARTAYIVTYSSDNAGFDAPLADVRRLIASIRLPA